MHAALGRYPFYSCNRDRRSIGQKVWQQATETDRARTDYATRERCRSGARVSRHPHRRWIGCLSQEGPEKARQSADEVRRLQNATGKYNLLAAALRSRR